MTRRLRPAALTFVVVALVAPRAYSQSCRDTAYLGFDTRLTATVVARAPLTSAPVAAFEISAGRPLIAQGTSLWVSRGNETTAANLKLPLRAILVDDKGQVTLHAGDALYRLGAAAPEAIARSDLGRLHRSGTPATVDAKQAATSAQFVLRHDDGRTLPLATIPGALRLASWNTEGLAAIVGRSLFEWRPGEPDLLRLATDEGLERARDLVLIGPSRVVVALNESLVLLTPQGRLVLGNIRARVRWAAGTLYALDERTGIVWSLKGLEPIGRREVDEDYAAALIRALPADAPETHVAFMEAARIVGCEVAEALRPKRTAPAPQ